MAYLKEMRLYGTTDAGGDLTLTAARPVLGRLAAVRYLGANFDATADATLSTVNHEAAGTLLALTNANSDATYYPRAQLHDGAGAGVTYDGSNGVYDMPLLVGVPRLVVAQGGNAKAGGVVLFYYED